MGAFCVVLQMEHDIVSAYFSAELGGGYCVCPKGMSSNHLSEYAVKFLRQLVAKHVKIGYTSTMIYSKGRDAIC